MLFPTALLLQNENIWKTFTKCVVSRYKLQEREIFFPTACKEILPEDVPSDRLGAPPKMVVGSSTRISGTTFSDLLGLGSSVTLIWIIGIIWSPSSLVLILLVDGLIIAFSWRRLFLSLMSLQRKFFWRPFHTKLWYTLSRQFDLFCHQTYYMHSCAYIKNQRE